MKENHLAAAEMSEEENYNQIDGVITGTPARASVLEALRQSWLEDGERRKKEAERQRETTPERKYRTPPGEDR